MHGRSLVSWSPVVELVDIQLVVSVGIQLVVSVGSQLVRQERDEKGRKDSARVAHGRSKEGRGLGMGGVSTWNGKKDGKWEEWHVGDGKREECQPQQSVNNMRCSHTLTPAPRAKYQDPRAREGKQGQ